MAVGGEDSRGAGVPGKEKASPSCPKQGSLQEGRGSAASEKEEPVWREHPAGDRARGRVWGEGRGPRPKSARASAMEGREGGGPQ